MTNKEIKELEKLKKVIDKNCRNNPDADLSLKTNLAIMRLLYKLIVENRKLPQGWYFEVLSPPNQEAQVYLSKCEF